MSNIYQNMQLERIADSLSGNEMQFALGVSVPMMEGATANADGAAGLVPAPAAGDESKFLSGAGTWEEAGGGGSSVDIITNGVVDTGFLWDGYPIKCLCIQYNNLPIGTTQTDSLTNWGFSDSINGVLKIDGFYPQSGGFSVPIDCSNYYVNNNSKQITFNFSLAPLWTWSVGGSAYLFIYYY